MTSGEKLFMKMGLVIGGLSGWGVAAIFAYLLGPPPILALGFCVFIPMTVWTLALMAGINPFSGERP